MKADRNLPHVPVTWKSGASAPREAFRNQRGLHGEVCPLPLEFVILEAEEEPSYEIVRIGEFLHMIGFSHLHKPKRSA
jgi:hypothetical protein